MDREDKAVDIDLSTKKFASNVFIRFLTLALVSLRSLIFLPVIAKTFGATTYGIWSQITITLALLTPILMLRLEMACVRYLGNKKDKRVVSKQFFSLLIIIWVILLIVEFLIHSFPDRMSYFMFGDEKLILFTELFAILLFIRVTYVFIRSYYRSFNKIKTYSIIELIQSFSEIAIIILFVLYMDLGLKGAILALIIVESVLIIGILTDIVRKIGFSINYQTKERLVPLLKYSIPLIPAGALYWIVNMSDRYMILHFLNLKEVGIYSATYNLAGLLLFFTTPISFVIFPTISKLWEQKKIGQTKQYLEESTKIFLILAIPSTVGICYLSPYILRFLATEEFVTSSTLIVFIAVGYIFIGIMQILIYVFHLIEKSYIMPFVVGTVAAFNIAFNLIYIPRFGIIGAAFTTFMSYVLLAAIYMYLIKLWFPIKIGYKTILKSITSTVIMIVVLMMFTPTNILYTAGLVLLGGLIYFVFMILLRGIGKKEWKLFKSIFVKK